MPKNKGKKFETQFKESAEKENIFILRLNDTDLSYNGNHMSRFVPKSPYDFIIYVSPHIYCFELKSTKYSSFSFQRNPEEPEKMIKYHQIKSLAKAGSNKGIYAGLVLNFRDDNTNEEETYFISIKDFYDFMIDTDKKSINKEDVKKFNGILIEQKKKRVLYTYNIEKLLNDIVDQIGED